jgi:hypothetical protein
LQNGSAPANDKEALVVSVGAGLVSQSRPSDVLSDYLEGDNAHEDLVFERGPPSSEFNDQIRIVAP